MTNEDITTILNVMKYNIGKEYLDRVTDIINNGLYMTDGKTIIKDPAQILMEIKFCANDCLNRLENIHETINEIERDDEITKTKGDGEDDNN